MRAKSLKSVLCVEELESRLAPATFRFRGAGDGGASWFDEDTWQIWNDARNEWEATPDGEIPGKNRNTDDVKFSDRYAGSVVMSQSVTLHRVLFQSDSGSSINFNG